MKDYGLHVLLIRHRLPNIDWALNSDKEGGHGGGGGITKNKLWGRGG